MIIDKRSPMKKSFLLLVIASSLASSIKAQPYMTPSMLNTSTHKLTFWDVQHAFDEYWKTREPSLIESENADEGGYQQFKRWEWFVKQRTFPSGIFYSPEILYKEFQKYKSKFKDQHERTGSNWTFIGPSQVPGNGGGAGRINCLAFHPTDPNTLFVGTACGGLWKSTDGGSTWTSNTDLLPSLSISEIIIDSADPNIMYIATGDKYGIYWQYETIGHYSAGVMKSTDGGATWNQMGLNYTQNNITIIQRLIMSPANHNILHAATNNGIYKSLDAGVTWTNQLTGKFYDIEYCPTNSNIVYTGDSTGFEQSTDGGASWNYISGVTSTGRTSISVTTADSSVVYIWSEGGGLYYSSNFGVTFTQRTDPLSVTNAYGYYDCVLDISPLNKNILLAGGLIVALSTDGGNTWNAISDWGTWPAGNYVHADNHDLKFAPASSQIIYSLNDGGIFKSTDQGATWTDLSNGLDIKQYYRLGCSYLTPGLIYAGAQDNGTDRVTGATSNQVMGADGEECLVDFTNDNIVFASSQSGYFSKSTDGGNTFTPLTAYGSDWTSPIIMDPNDHNKMYLGANDVEGSTDNGGTWNPISGSLDGNAVYSLEVSNSNGNYIYAATFGNIFRTTNGGASWNNITGTLPVANAAIDGIAVNGNNPDAFWVVFSGYAAGEKVFYTSNGGSTWTNVSGTLPNIPVNCIEYQNNSNDLLYIGTDFGVFYTDATQSDWIPYNTGMPNVIIDELEIHYPTSKLRAATYGRGLWESDLQTSTLLTLDAGVSTVLAPPSQTCDSLITPIVRIRNYGTDTLHTVTLHYHIDAQADQIYNWLGTLPALGIADITLPTYTLSGGVHNFYSYTANPNSGTDLNAGNDNRNMVFTILSGSSAIMTPVSQGFVSTTFPPAGWTLQNSSNLWSRDNTVGGFGLSSESAMANFYNINGGQDKIISSYINFTQLVAPITLTFDVAYAPYDASYHDSLIVDLFSDCSTSSTRVYAKGDLTLATAAATTNIFYPLSSQWRTETVNLNSYAGSSPMEIRFIGKSGFGNDLFLDNINLTSNNVGIYTESDPENSLKVFPNPSSGKVYVEISSNNSHNTSVILSDVMGDELYKIDDQNFTRKNRYEIDMNRFANGIYFIKVNSGSLVETRKISVMK